MRHRRWVVAATVTEDGAGRCTLGAAVLAAPVLASGPAGPP
ncbi:hypothetical protein [Fodinicola feengrottensis]|nr:hypothetical protein [Fodinicola feengrottensis]